MVDTSFNFLQILFLLVSFSAITSYINSKYLKLPAAVGVTVAAVILVIVVNYLDRNHFGSGFTSNIQALVKSFNFYDFLLNGIIGFLLFASAIKFEISNLKRWWWQISLLSTIGVVISTVSIGAIIYAICSLLNVAMPISYCMLFGAIMSPTDPIAAVAAFKEIRQSNPNNPEAVPKHIEIKLLGESLFNDGMGIVVFLTILGYAINTQTNIDLSTSVSSIFVSLTQEIVGAVILGLVSGNICKYFLKKIKGNNFTEIALFSLTLCVGSYELALMLHFSAPIAVVVAGLVVGHKVKQLYSDHQLHHLHLFWEFIDELLNTSLFALMGITVVFIHFDLQLFLLGVLGYFVVLFGRYISLITIFFVPKRYGKVLHGAIPILTYGGIRGGISLALALALLTTKGMNVEFTNLLIGMTFISVLLSNFIQGMTLKHMIAAFYPTENSVHSSMTGNNLLEYLDNTVQMCFNKLNKKLVITERTTTSDVQKPHEDATLEQVIKEQISSSMELSEEELNLDNMTDNEKNCL